MVIISNIFSIILNAETQRRREFLCFSPRLCVPAFVFPHRLFSTIIKSLRLCVSAFVFSLLPCVLFSQAWNWIQVVSGDGEMDLTSLAVDSRNNTFVSGTYTGSFTAQNASHQAINLADNFLMKLDDTGEIEWVITGGSEGNDTDSGICVDEADALYWVGGFWLEGQYGELQFNSTKSSKSLFFIKYTTEKEVAWAKLIEGTNAKNSGPPAVDQEGNVYLAGSFSDSLFIDQQIRVAQAREDIFIGKWDRNGELLWLKNFGVEGLNRAWEVLINQQKEVLIGGSFKGKIAFPQDTITANTPDFDVFIAALTENGSPLWIQKAGGVLEDSFSSMTLDQSDNLYVVGQYTGRLTLSDNLEITTEGFNENGYLLKYSPLGTPLQAISIGGTTFETSTDIIADEQLVLSGFFEKDLTVGDQQIMGEGALSGYLLTLDSTGTTSSLLDISADNLLLINELAKTDQGNTLVGGTFKGNTTFLGESFSSPDYFSLFIGNYAANNTTNTVSIDPPFSFDIYPNPADQLIHITTNLSEFQVKLWNQQGQLVFTGDSITVIPAYSLPNGIYMLEIRLPLSFSRMKKIVVQH